MFFTSFCSLTFSLKVEKIEFFSFVYWTLHFSDNKTLKTDFEDSSRWEDKKEKRCTTIIEDEDSLGEPLRGTVKNCLSELIDNIEKKKKKKNEKDKSGMCGYGGLREPREQWYQRDLFISALATQASDPKGGFVNPSEWDYESMADLLVDTVCMRFLGPLFFKKLAETKEGKEFVTQQANKGNFFFF